MEGDMARRSKRIPIPDTIAGILAPGDIEKTLELFRTTGQALAEGILIIAVNGANADDAVSLWSSGVDRVTALGSLEMAREILMNHDESSEGD
jgi:hypothetical protein